MKKLFCVILCAVLLTGILPLDALAATEYDLVIAGITVTSLNKNDILGNGALSFDPGTNTLTVRGDCNCSSAKKSVIKNSIPGLTLYVEKDSTLISDSDDDSPCIFLYGSLKITGPGLLKLVSKDSNGIRCNYRDGKALTLENATVEIESDGFGIMWCSSVNIYDSYLHVNNGIYQCNSINKNDCTITEPVGGRIGAPGTVYKDYDNMDIATNVTIEKAYGFLVGGKYATKRNKNDILNNGVFSYDPESNVLTVKGNYSCSSSVIENQNQGLTVFVAKNSVLKCTSYYPVIDADESLTITGPGKLTLKGYKGITVTSVSNHTGTVTIENAVVEINGSRHGIKSAYGLGVAYLVVRNSYLRCTSDESSKTTGAIAYINITLDGATIVKPSDAGNINMYGGMISGIMKDGVYADEVEINTFYDLYVSGSQVTALSAPHIVDGKIRYDAGINVLYVNGTYSAAGTYPTIENRIPNLTIYALDTATLSSSSTALLVKADTMITGPGLLSLSGSTCGIFVRDGARLTVVNAGMMVGGGDGIMGISPSDGASLTVNSSHMIITSTDNAAVFNLASITLNGSVITSPSGAYISGGDILQSNGAYAKTVTISTPVTTVKTVDIAISEPAVGNTVAYNSVTIGAEGYGIEYGFNNSTWSMGVIWKENGETLYANEAHTFVSGNKYTVTVSVVITDTERYRFAPAGEMKAYINGKEATVIKYSSTNYGISYTFDFTPPTVVTDIYITVPEPEAGDLIYYHAATDDGGYRVQTEYNNGILWESGVAWYCDGSPLCPQDDEYFIADHDYRVEISIVLTDEDRYEFGNGMDMYILVNGKYADYRKVSDTNIIVHYYFFLEAEPIDEIQIFDYNPPAVGKKAGESDTSKVYDARFDISETDWYCDTDHRYMSDSDVFEAGKLYSHRWELKANEGYAFDENNVSVTINDETGLVDEKYVGFGDSETEYIVWTKSVEPVNIISEVRLLGFRDPEAGQTVNGNLASLAVPGDAPYELGICEWLNDYNQIMSGVDVFAEGELYLLCVVLIPKAGYIFDPENLSLRDGSGTEIAGSYCVVSYNTDVWIEREAQAASDIKYGDVNGDGKINGQDLVRLRKHLNGENVFIGPGANVNGDAEGKVNGQDLIRLRKYLNGENVVLGPN